MLNYLFVGLGGAIGTIGRFWLGGVISRRFGETFPLGTLVINVTGSFVITFFATLTAPEGRWMVSPNSRSVLHDRHLRRVHHFFLIQSANT